MGRGTMSTAEGRPKVAHIITRLIVGGAQENTLATIKGLNEIAGFETVLISGPPRGPEGSLWEQAEKDGISIIKVPELQREISPWPDLVAFFKLFSLLRKNGYAIVHTHSSKAGFLGRIAAKLAGVPVVVHTIHGLPFHSGVNWLLRFVYVQTEKLAALFSDRIISVCDNMTAKAVRARVAPPGKFVTIYSGFDVRAWRKARIEEAGKDRLAGRLGIREEDIVVGKVGRLFPLKGHKYFLKAAAILQGKHEREFSDLKFLLIGDGILKDELKKQARDLGIDKRVIFAGLLPPEEMPAALALMDVVVHASLREGLARVLPQALMQEKPVVTFDIDGASEVIKDGETGILVPAKDVEAMAAGIHKVLTEKEMAREMAKKGRQRVEKRFPVEIMVKRISELYHALLQEEKKRKESLP